MEHYPLRVKWATMALVLAPLAVSGCALGGSSGPKPAKGAARDAATVVGRLETATARGDWRAVCDDVFTASARARAGGNDCPRLLRSDAGRVTRPSIDVVRITVRGPRAEVRVRTRAGGQPPLEDVIELRRERGRYRVDSLQG
jgi:hypothetical protein